MLLSLSWKLISATFVDWVRVVRIGNGINIRRCTIYELLTIYKFCIIVLQSFVIILLNAWNSKCDLLSFHTSIVSLCTFTKSYTLSLLRLALKSLKFTHSIHIICIIRITYWYWHWRYWWRRHRRNSRWWTLLLVITCKLFIRDYLCLLLLCLRYILIICVWIRWLVRR